MFRAKVFPLSQSLARSVLPSVSHRAVHVSCARRGNKKAIRKDMRKRRTVVEYEKERLLLRAMVRNKIVPEIVQRKVQQDMASQPRDASITRVRNRCVQTGRGRAVLTDFGLCRMKFRKLADFGMIAGLTRSSW